jgi:riboflavin kinase/FMN adenylyltransferase
LKIYTNINENIDLAEPIEMLPQKSVATIGFFDGVHLGHKYLINQLQNIACKHKSEELIITLWPHSSIYFGKPIKLLNTLKEKIEIFKNIGVNNLLIIDFNQQIANMSGEEFTTLVLKHKYRVDTVVMGYNNSFGRKDNNVDVQKYSSINLIKLSEYKINNVSKISSSVIRNYLNEGDVENAAKLLGYNYILSGNIKRGYQIGREIGFPTANLNIPDSYKLIPADGVYIIEVRLNNSWLPAMLNIGVRPSFNGSERSVEFHILDFDGDLYRRELSLRFIKKIRSETKFENIDDLVGQLNKDKDTTRAFFNRANA